MKNNRYSTAQITHCWSMCEANHQPPHLGLWPLLLVTAQREWLWQNHKRVYRIYCELDLNLWIEPKKRLKRDKPRNSTSGPH